jgi:uncharacterized membrane protein YcaP (DUF421 family)
MWHDMFVQQLPFWEKAIRTVVIYALIAVLFRITGKRGMAALNTLDFVVMFLLSNVVQNAIIGNDNSITGGVIGAVTLVAVNAGANRLALYSSWFAWLFDGTDTTVIRDGAVVQRAVRRLGLRDHELDHAVRLQNGDDLAQVERGVLEPAGQLVLTLKPSEQGATKGDVEALDRRLDRIERLLIGN